MSVSESYKSGEAEQQYPSWLSDDTIKAVPLGNITADRVKAKPGKEGLAFFWAQKNPMNIQKKIYMGFEYATNDDCIVPGVPCIDNRFTNMDTVLLKISKAKYQGALKYNTLKNLSAIHGADAAEKFHQEFFSQPGANNYKGKVEAINTNTDTASDAVKQFQQKQEATVGSK